ncbi:fluoride efflux transporter CrcB [Streptomyces sp. MST-110588]|uniref:fluoride efflux transporter CrcB n=1 Tax=Streptomyces sp. MST-110588 TaxID=2833628 RepID=UPI001F5C24C4|nr:fluoride efflux transporter CrcB [Streptomyces sp. MST-110588]UNO39984.1 fluoride efflux transporter CrcB [Streptomyces sp. MST-110588]
MPTGASAPGVEERVGAPGDAAVPARRQPPPWHGQGAVIAAVSAGGGIGAAARYAASLIWPQATDGFPWTTLAVNVIGCALMGALMVLVTERGPAHRLARPFLGTGVLGGFTTFSTYALDVRHLLELPRAAPGLACLVATPLAALAAVWCASALTRRLLPPGRWQAQRAEGAPRPGERGHRAGEKEHRPGEKEPRAAEGQGCR